jgi:serine phosphatase RsbU (regulator of sigma subunit)
MQLGIRTKFIGILLVAAVIPLCIGIIGVWVLGARYYRQEKGILFESLAIHLAQGLNQAIDGQVEALDDWLLLSNLYPRIRAHNQALPAMTDAEFATHIQEMEARWPTLDPASPELRGVLTNSMARGLEAFRVLHPLLVEVFATDIKGQLVAATEKTSDYWQADEAWWQRGMKVGYRRVYAEGITFDQSAKVYSLDVAIPIYRRAHPDRPPVGVLKGVFSISPLFSKVRPIFSDPGARRQLVDAEGRDVFELDRHRAGSFQKGFSQDAVKRLASNNPGWSTEKAADGSTRLVGYAPVRLTGPLMDASVPFGVQPLYVIVHDDDDAVLAPVRRHLWLLSATGGLVVLVFGLGGLYIANRKIITPVQRLRSAAQLVAASAKLTDATVPDATPVQSRASRASTGVLNDVRGIDTGDEIQGLAQDFVSMAVRVLRYHEQLEEEIAFKTGEIQRDLQFAREFQEALMPRDYPQVPSQTCTDPLALNFHHVYMPASSVGGDFFDVLKLDDHRAGVFIADVMGHGARSALVTAILRTLLQDLSSEADDPARFLELMNHHFYGLVEQSKQFIFVSAFYLIVDTQKALATYASAGHPSPLVAERRRETVRPLIQNLHDNPALGLFRESHYTSFTSFTTAGDLFLLYTDGVIEATNMKDEEFGHERLCHVLKENLKRDVTGLTDSVIEAVNQFRGSRALSDDICLVAVEVAASPKPTAPQPAETGAAG